MTASKLSRAKPTIAKFLNEYPDRVFRHSELATIFRDHRQAWGLAKKTSVDNFIDELLTNADLKQLDFPFASRHEIRYVWGSAPILEVLSTLKPRAYFSHHTAARLHTMTAANLHQIYLNLEQRPHQKSSSSLTQDRIDRAFLRPQRTTTNIVKVEHDKIYLLNGMSTGELGVIEETITDDGVTFTVRVTNVERTLIDLAVRPVYAGGVAEVAMAFRKAKGRASIEQLAAMLTDLEYVYPYHQSIGYYLEAAGYSTADVDLFRSMPMHFDFYLANQLLDTQYIPPWRLHVPKNH